MSVARLPALFLGHGTPLNALRNNRYTEFWQALAPSFAKPAKVLVISGHWCTAGIRATAMEWPPTIHDFGGFPGALHAMRYPAPGAPELVEQLRALLAPLPVEADHEWGLDHGCWVLLSKLYPAADIPVVQLSLDLSQPAAVHYEIGQKLAPLREEGVLILGSGNVVHNLMMRIRDQPIVYGWALRFNGHVRAAVLAQSPEKLIDYEALGEDARLSVPTPDHYYPLLTVAGAASADQPAIGIDGIEGGAVSMLSVLYGASTAWPPLAGAPCK